MSEQTQPGTALQALAEKLRTDAIAIFGEGQAERDIIEWFYGSLLAAAPATPAAQGAVPEPVRDALARRCLWLAFCWNDHNFGPAHEEARKEALKHGIDSFDAENEWLAAAPAHPAERKEQGEVQRLREMLERATKLLSAAAGYATKMEPMPAKLLNAIDTALAACPGQEVEK